MSEWLCWHHVLTMVTLTLRRCDTSVGGIMRMILCILGLCWVDGQVPAETTGTFPSDPVAWGVETWYTFAGPIFDGSVTSKDPTACSMRHEHDRCCGDLHPLTSTMCSPSGFHSQIQYVGGLKQVAAHASAVPCELNTKVRPSGSGRPLCVCTIRSMSVCGAVGRARALRIRHPHREPLPTPRERGPQPELVPGPGERVGCSESLPRFLGPSALTSAV